jgi:hypothetical protein
MSGITNAQLKLAWAKGHLDLLDTEITSFANSNPYTLSRGDDLEHQRHVLRFNLLVVPDPICLVAGDAIYNMRACLDQLVWGLARLSGVPKRVVFPIIDGPVLTTSRWESFKRSLTDVPREAICEIESLQPYSRGAAYKGHPLWRLDEICNLDKHRRIPANGSASVIYFPNLTPSDRASGIVKVETSDDGFVVSVPIELKSKLDLPPTMSFTVHFRGDISGISETHKGLIEIYEFIAQGVLPRFTRFFQ